jgi:hypothetical protein
MKQQTAVILEKAYRLLGKAQSRRMVTSGDDEGLTKQK